MKRRYGNNICDSLKALMLACFVLLLKCSCSDDEKKGLIPGKTFGEILTQIHIADGLMMLPDIRDNYFNRDSTANYTDIIASYGYTKKDMDRTLKYYITEKPKKLIKIYDQAIGKLTEMETLLMEETYQVPSKPGELWKEEPFYYLYDEPENEKVYFDHIFFSRGDYTLQFTIVVSPADQSDNPCFTAWTSHADSVNTGKRHYFPSIKYVKDGHPHTYTFIYSKSDNSPAILKGWLYDSGNNPAGVYRHAKIENISFSFTPRAL
jgi:hypothetical protein